MRRAWDVVAGACDAIVGWFCNDCPEPIVVFLFAAAMLVIVVAVVIFTVWTWTISPWFGGPVTFVLAAAALAAFILHENDRAV